MEVSNITIGIIRTKYMEMNGYLFKSTTEFRKYNKMKVNDGDGDDDGDGVDAVAMEMMPKHPRIQDHSPLVWW
jgi:hypothetical protein